MAKSKVELNARAFTKTLNDVQKGYNLDILRAHSIGMDLIRRYSARSVILDNTKRKTPSGKLMSRTGLLRRTLKQKGSWKITQILAKLKNVNYLNFQIRPQSKGKSFEYVGKMGLMNKDKLKHRFGWEKRGRPFYQPAIDAKKETMRKLIGDKVTKMRKA